MADFYAKYPAQPSGGGGGGGITSINGDTTAAQLIVGGTGITVSTVSGTTTITATGGGSGTVTSVNVSGGTTGLTASGGPITTSGTITLAGTLNIANGGTGQVTAAAAFGALSPLTTKGDILGFSTVNARIPVGSDTQVLTADSTQTLGVKWVTPTAGTVTSVQVSGGTTGLTYSGGPITASGTITMAGTLNIANGGTGQTSAAAAFIALSPLTTAGDIIYENATPVPARLGIGSTGNVLTVSGGLPSWAPPATSGTVTSVQVSGGTTGLTYSGGPITSSGTITMAGTLAITNGGTGQITAAAAFSALSPITTTGDLIYSSSGTTNSRLAIGSTGNVLTVTGGVPTWSPPATSGTVTSVNASGGTTGLTFSGGPVTSSGTLTLAGTLNIVNGGTGAVTAAAGYNNLSPMTTTGDIEYEVSAGTAGRLAIGSTGNVLTVSGGIPSWAPPATSGTVTNVATDATLTGGPITTTGTLGINLATANTWTAAPTIKITDAGTTNAATVLTVSHDTSATAAVGFGTSIVFNGQDSTTADEPMAAINTTWTTATHASRSSQMAFQTVTTANALNTDLILGSGVSGGSAGGLIIGTQGLNNGAIWGTAVGTPTNANYALIATNGQTIIGSGGSSGSILFRLAGTSAINIPSTGGLAIGTGGGTVPTLGTVNKLTVIPNVTVDNAATTQFNSAAVANKNMVLQAIASQTANTFEVQQSTGTVLFSIGPAGNILKINNLTAVFPSVQGTANQVLSNDGAGNLSWATPVASQTSPLDVKNYGFTTSVAASALTINLQTAAGANPSAGDPVVVAFRNATSATGTYADISSTAATSIVISSGATLGQISAVATYFYVYGLNNAGTVELAVSTKKFDDGTIQSTTAMSGTATSATTLYSTTARTNVAIRLIGRMLVTETTAGTWASTPTEIALGDKFLTGGIYGRADGLAVPAGQIGETVVFNASPNVNMSTGFTDIISGGQTLGAGVWLLSGKVTLNANGATAMAYFEVSTSLVSATVDESYRCLLTTVNTGIRLPIINRVVVSTGSTLFYLVGSVGATVGGPPIAASYNVVALRVG